MKIEIRNKIIKEINKIGQSQHYLNKFLFHRIKNKRTVNGGILIEVKSNLTRKIKTVRLSIIRENKRIIFNYKRSPPDFLLKKEINKLGNSHKNKYKRFIFISSSKPIGYGSKRITVKNILSGERKTTSLHSLRRGRNPFTKRSIQSWKYEIKENINKWGLLKKWTLHEQYQFVKIVKKTIRDDFEIVIKNLLSGEKRTTLYYSLKIGINPFNKKVYLSPFYVKENINKWGKDGPEKDHFKLLKILPKNGKPCRVIVQSIHSKIKKEVYYDSLRSGTNPFRSVFNFEEREILHPKVKKILIKNKIQVLSYEKKLINTKPDFICKLSNGKVIIIEVKSGSKKWSKSEIKRQVSMYLAEGKKKFSYNFAGVILTSDNGKYGCSFSQINKKISSFY